VVLAARQTQLELIATWTVWVAVVLAVAPRLLLLEDASVVMIAQASERQNV